MALAERRRTGRLKHVGNTYNNLIALEDSSSPTARVGMTTNTKYQLLDAEDGIADRYQRRTQL